MNTDEYGSTELIMLRRYRAALRAVRDHGLCLVAVGPPGQEEFSVCVQHHITAVRCGLPSFSDPLTAIEAYVEKYHSTPRPVRPAGAELISREDIGGISMNRVEVRHAVMLHDAGLVTWEQAMMIAVTMLAEQVQSLLDRMTDACAKQPVEVVVDGKRFRMKPVAPPAEENPA